MESEKGFEEEEQAGGRARRRGDSRRRSTSDVSKLGSFISHSQSETHIDLSLATPREVFYGQDKFNMDLEEAKRKQYDPRQHGILSPPAALIDAFQDIKWSSSFFVYLDRMSNIPKDSDPPRMFNFLTRSQNPSPSLIHDYAHPNAPLMIDWSSWVKGLKVDQEQKTLELLEPPDVVAAAMEYAAFQTLNEWYETFKSVIESQNADFSSIKVVPKEDSLNADGQDIDLADPAVYYEGVISPEYYEGTIDPDAELDKGYSDAQSGDSSDAKSSENSSDEKSDT